MRDEQHYGRPEDDSGPTRPGRPWIFIPVGLSSTTIVFMLGYVAVLLIASLLNGGNPIGDIGFVLFTMNLFGFPWAIWLGIAIVLYAVGLTIALASRKAHGLLAARIFATGLLALPPIILILALTNSRYVGP